MEETAEVTKSLFGTHYDPHLEEYISLTYYAKEGNDINLFFWGMGSNLAAGVTPEDFEKKGVTMIGVAKSFSDHHTVDGSVKSDQCSATLVAKKLCIEDLPAVKAMNKFALLHDLTSADQPFDLASLVKLMHYVFPGDEENHAWVMELLSAKYDEYEKYGERGCDSPGVDMEELYQDWLYEKYQGKIPDEELLFHQRIKKYLKMVRKSNRLAPFEFPDLMRSLRLENMEDLKTVKKSAFRVFEAKFLEQKKFLTETKYEFWNQADIRQVKAADGDVPLVAIKTDNFQIQKFARSAVNAAIVVQLNTGEMDGNVQIIPNKHKYPKLNLSDAFWFLVFEEMSLEGNDIELYPDMIQNGGSLTICPKWHYHQNAGSILNGTRSARDIPATLIPFQHIVSIVEFSINPDEAERRALCKTGVCSATGKNPCPLYKLRLASCQKIWQEIKKYNTI